MSDRIDHAQEARNVMHILGVTPMESSAANVSALAANTHATLALVEQARIGNLIALAGLPTFTGSVSDYADELRGEALATLARYESSPPDYEAIVVDPDIAASLGLGVGE